MHKKIMPVGAGLSSPATLLFNRPITGLLSQMNGEPIDINNDQYEALKANQSRYTEYSDTHKDSLSFPIGPMVAIQHEDAGPWTHSQ